jgi:hypothetical protein
MRTARVAISLYRGEARRSRHAVAAGDWILQIPAGVSERMTTSNCCNSSWLGFRRDFAQEALQGN